MSKTNDAILQGLIPCDGHVLVQGKDNKYKSQNNIISNLTQGGSAVMGTVIRLGENVPQDLLNAECLILKYEVSEVQENVFIVNYADHKLRMFKKEKGNGE